MCVLHSWLNMDYQDSTLSSLIVDQLVCVLGFCCCGETMTKSTWGGKSLLHLTTPRSQSNTKGIRAGTELLLLLACCSVCFSCIPQHHAQWAGPCIHHSLIKKMAHRLAYRPVFLKWGFVFSNDCVNLTKRNKSPKQCTWVYSCVCYMFLAVFESGIEFDWWTPISS